MELLEQRLQPAQDLHPTQVIVFQNAVGRRHRMDPTVKDTDRDPPLTRVMGTQTDLVGNKIAAITFLFFFLLSLSDVVECNLLKIQK